MRGAANRATVHRAVLIIENYLAPNAGGPRLRNPAFRQCNVEQRVESGLELNLGSATYELRDLGQFVLHF